MKKRRSFPSGSFFDNSWVLFFLSLAMMLGPAYALFDSFHFDPSKHHDIETYLGLAAFDFDQSPVRRYRILVPLLAAGVDFLLGPLFDRLQPWHFPGPDFSLGISFLIVNSTIMALAGTFLFRMLRSAGTSVPASIIGLLSALSCRWVSYIAGLPLVDSLYFLVLTATLYGLVSKNKLLIILMIFLGPWAKESFIFIAPLIFFFGPVPRGRQVVLFLLSGVMVFAFRYGYDVLNHLDPAAGLRADVGHIHVVQQALDRLFSFHGAYEIFSVTGVWALLFLGLGHSRIRKKLQCSTPEYMYWYVAAVLIHALLSTELARMFFLATPVLALWYGFITDTLLQPLKE